MQIYKSKHGMAVWVPLIIILLFMSILAFKDSRAWIAVFILILVAGVIYYNISSIRYIIDDSHLTIQGGFSWKKIIPIKDIRNIKETNNPLAAPAGSLDRLEIRYNKSNSVIISPKTKMHFINALVSKNPDIEVIFSRKKGSKQYREIRKS